MSENNNSSPGDKDQEGGGESGGGGEEGAIAVIGSSKKKRSNSACLQLEDLEPRGVVLKSASVHGKRPITPPREETASVESSGGAGGIMPEPNFTRYVRQRASRRSLEGTGFKKKIDLTKNTKKEERCTGQIKIIFFFSLG